MNPQRVYDYLVVSRGHLFEWTRQLSPEQYRQEHPIGLGSLARTLHHMMAAEWSYMRRVRGEMGPLREPSKPEHDPEVTTADALGFDELERAWTGLAAQTRADLAAVQDWDTAHVYTTMWEGEPYLYQASVGDIVSQLVLHEVHHRAQAMHMLKRLGIETGEIDYNALMWKEVDG